ncbi:MAG TPA: hypothetical protein VNL15_06280 [Dehalococcoidia bacterium]|nr:hypothetical protein [Dehalococcoidia bacterium]
MRLVFIIALISLLLAAATPAMAEEIPYGPELPGPDANCDGEISIADALTVLEALATGTEACGGGDANCDGIVEVADAIIILRAIVYGELVCLNIS